MRALVYDRYGPPDVLHVDDVPTPKPGADEVLVRTLATSVNAADLDYVRGWPLVARLGTGMRRPKYRILGRDLAGEVETVGTNVSEFEPGDRVWADLTDFGCGTFAEYVSVPVAGLRPIPEGVAVEQAATVPHSAVLGLQGLRRGGHLHAGHHVLVNGGGGNVGPFAIQIAKAMGARVTAVDSAAKLEVMRAVGADTVIDYAREDYTAGDERYDVILDVSAHHSLLANRRVLAPDGMYSMIGGSTGHMISSGLLGPVLGMFGEKKSGIPLWKANDADDLAALGKLIAQGKIEPYIERRIGLEDVPDVLQRLFEGSARAKSVVVL